MAKYNKLTKQLSEKTYEKVEGQALDPTQFYKEQIAILESARPYTEEIVKAFDISIGITYFTIIASFIESIFCIITTGAYCACNEKKKINEKTKNIISILFQKK